MSNNVNSRHRAAHKVFFIAIKHDRMNCLLPPACHQHPADPVFSPYRLHPIPSPAAAPAPAPTPVPVVDVKVSTQADDVGVAGILTAKGSAQPGNPANGDKGQSICKIVNI